MKIIAFTGAGISKQSNIPTFQDLPEVREKLFRDYALSHPKEYNEVIKTMKENMRQAYPNDAHKALSEYHIPVITMNIDGLHKLAGSDALELHGGLPEDHELEIAYKLYNKPVLYGDPAPNYAKAYELVSSLKKGDIFLVIGCSYHTMIAVDLRNVARYNQAKVIEIQEDAKRNVRRVLEELLKGESYD